jgi:hypothetical protein
MRVLRALEFPSPVDVVFYIDVSREERFVFGSLSVLHVPAAGNTGEDSGERSSGQRAVRMSLNT